MRTQFEFTSGAFPAYPGEEELINPGRFGKRFAEFLQTSLPAHGFEVTGIINEVWGGMVELRNVAFPLWIGCGNVDGSETEFMGFIEPSKPLIRRWFKKPIPTTEVVEKLSSALESVLLQSGKVEQFRWIS